MLNNTKTSYEKAPDKIMQLIFSFWYHTYKLPSKEKPADIKKRHMCSEQNMIVSLSYFPFLEVH